LTNPIWGERQLDPLGWGEESYQPYIGFGVTHPNPHRTGQERKGPFTFTFPMLERGKRERLHRGERGRRYKKKSASPELPIDEVKVRFGSCRRGQICVTRGMVIVFQLFATGGEKITP